MDKKNFIQILRNPKEISENELDELETVVSQYPYFQTARAILASGSKALGKSDSDKKLSTAAIYTTNRNLLKRYVFETLDFSHISEIKVGAASHSTNDNDRNDDNAKKRKKFIFVERKEEITERTGKGKFIDLTKKSDEDEEDYLVVSESITTGDSIDWETKLANQETDEIQKSTPKDIENTPRKIVARKPEEFTQLPPRVNNDELVDDIFRNLEEYKKRKNHYSEVEQKILDLEETEAVNDAILKASERLKTDTEPEENTEAEHATDESQLFKGQVDPEVDETEEIKTSSNQQTEPTEYQEQNYALEREKRSTTSLEDNFKAEENKAEIKEKTSNASQNESRSIENNFEIKVQNLAFKDSEKKSTASISEETDIEKAEPTTPMKDETESGSQRSELEKASKNSKVEDKDEDSFAKMVADIKKSNTFHEPPLEVVQPEVAKSKKTSPKSGKIEKQSAIIENFIKANPKIVPSEDDNNKEIKDLSIESTNLKEGLATENLAKIFLKQGRREKAIEIYEQLILINPDKKSYFASQISKLK